MSTKTRTFIIILYFVLFMNLGVSKFIFTNWIFKKRLLIDNNLIIQNNIELSKYENGIAKNEIVKNEIIDKKKSLNALDDYDVIMIFI